MTHPIRIALYTAALGFAPQLLANDSLAQRYACAACHQADFRAGGPSWKEISGRYKEAQPSELAASIRAGSAGKWGSTPMPAQSQVSEADLEKLARWILAR